MNLLIWKGVIHKNLELLELVVLFAELLEATMIANVLENN